VSRNAFFLEPTPPFRLDLTVWTLRRRPDNAIDRWDGTTYRRALALANGPVEVAVYRLASRDAELGPLAERFRGMKPPRFPSVFEGIVNSIACQQVTLTLGIHLLNRLAEGHSPVVVWEEGPARAFPRPEDVALLAPEALRELGFSRQKGRAMIELAQISAEGHEELEALAALPDEEAIARLCRLRGVGRWSAEYVLLRSLGRTHIFLTVTDFGGQLDADMTRQNGHDLRPRATEGGGSWPKESRHGRREGTVPSVCRSRKRTICGSSMIPRRFGAPLMIVSVRPLSCSR